MVAESGKHGGHNSPPKQWKLYSDRPGGMLGKEVLITSPQYPNAGSEALLASGCFVRAVLLQQTMPNTGVIMGKCIQIS